MKNLLLILIALPTFLFAQENEEFKQRINGYLSSVSNDFDKKNLETQSKDIGCLEEQDYEWSQHFLLKNKEKKVNNIGNKAYSKYYFSFFTYPDITERDYAVKFWLKDFLNHETVRPGREMRTYTDAHPTIIVINKTSIAVMTYSCNWYEEDRFKELRKEMLTWFGSPESTMIEVGCEGPLTWSKNPPDPKDRSWK